MEHHQALLWWTRWFQVHHWRILSETMLRHPNQILIFLPWRTQAVLKLWILPLKFRKIYAWFHITHFFTHNINTYPSCLKLLRIKVYQWERRWRIWWWFFKEVEKTSLRTFRKVMKLSFDNIWFDVSDAIIALLPKLMDFKFFNPSTYFFILRSMPWRTVVYFIWDP